MGMSMSMSEDIEMSNCTVSVGIAWDGALVILLHLLVGYTADVCI